MIYPTVSLPYPRIPEWVHDKEHEQSLKDPNHPFHPSKWDPQNPPDGWVWEECTSANGPKEGQGMGQWGFSKVFK